MQTLGTRGICCGPALATRLCAGPRPAGADARAPPGPALVPHLRPIAVPSPHARAPTRAYAAAAPRRNAADNERPWDDDAAPRQRRDRADRLDRPGADNKFRHKRAAQTGPNAGGAGTAWGPARGPGAGGNGGSRGQPSPSTGPGAPPDPSKPKPSRPWMPKEQYEQFLRERRESAARDRADRPADGAPRPWAGGQDRGAPRWRPQTGQQGGAKPGADAPPPAQTSPRFLRAPRAGAPAPGAPPRPPSRRPAPAQEAEDVDLAALALEEPAPPAAPDPRAGPARDAELRDREKHRRAAARRRAGGPGGARRGREGDGDEDGDAGEGGEARARRAAARPAPAEVTVTVPDTISVANLAQAMGLDARAVARRIGEMGLEEGVGVDYMLPSELASLVVLEYGMNPVVASTAESDAFDVEPRPPPADWSAYPPRPPVVTIMGHVDHGKTTLLDALRRTSVAASEAGGITQHIGAFSVPVRTTPGGAERRITFLDTPGHAAFSAMRRRGARATDVVVLVVAADDGVMPQTVEALRHAREADAPIVVAVTKCDRHQARPERALEGLLREGLQVEEMGGDVPAVRVAAPTGQGLAELVEAVSALAEVQLDVRGDPEGPTEAVVLESAQERGVGAVATLLVRRGTLRAGQVLVAGTSVCRVRSMADENGAPLAEAGPSAPARVTGWRDPPAAGEAALEVRDADGRRAEDLARRAVEARAARLRRAEGWKLVERMNEARARRRREREEEKESKGRKAGGGGKEEKQRVLNVVVKADVHGSVEAIVGVLEQIPQDEVRVRVVGSGVGPVTEEDVRQAAVDNGVIFAFNLKPPVGPRLMHLALSQGVRVRQHAVIYRLADDARELVSELLPPEVRVEVVGEATVQQRFDISVKGKGSEAVAGSRVDQGKIAKNALVRVVRAGATLWEGHLRSLRHFKKDVPEIAKGSECGIGLDGFEAFEPGDLIQAIVKTEVKRKL